MTVPGKGNPEDDPHHPASSVHEGEDHCCGGDHHHEEEDTSGEAESHCGGGCCADDEEDCESSVDPCEDSCCGHDDDGDDQCVDKEDRQGKDLSQSLVGGFFLSFRLTRGLRWHNTDTCCPGGSATPKSGDPRCCKPATDGAEEKSGSGKCIPNGTSGCQRAALLRSTCCGSSTSFIPGITDLRNTLYCAIT